MKGTSRRPDHRAYARSVQLLPGNAVQLGSHLPGKPRAFLTGVGICRPVPANCAAGPGSASAYRGTRLPGTNVTVAPDLLRIVERFLVKRLPSPDEHE